MALATYTSDSAGAYSFVGLANFVTLLTDAVWSKPFWNAAWNNLVFFAIHMAVQNPIGGNSGLRERRAGWQAPRAAVSGGHAQPGRGQPPRVDAVMRKQRVADPPAGGDDARCDGRDVLATPRSNLGRGDCEREHQSGRDDDVGPKRTRPCARSRVSAA